MPQDPRQEWLVTDSCGGFFCGTASGELTRKWHGWWVARKPPRDRVRLVAGFEMRLRVGNEWHDLTARWEDSNWQVPSLGPLLHGWDFTTRLIPGAVVKWTVAVPGGIILLRAESDVDSSQNPLLEVRWLLPFQPKIRRSGTDKASLGKYEGFRLHLHGSDGLTLEGKSERLVNVSHEIEKDCEDTWTEGLWRTPRILIERDQLGSYSIMIEASAEPSPWYGCAPYHREWHWGATPSGLRDFVASAYPFIVRNQSSRLSVLAGYPWFSDWGRDTMIALPGLCIKTGNAQHAADIIDHFLEHLDEGLIPNLFPESGEQPRYNTIDATLWLIDTAFRVDREMNGEYVRGERWEKMRTIIDWHCRGTKNDIKLDMDGLLAGGSPGSQLTWMDVKVDGHVPTPRHGKPVEIQGLWYNALLLMAGRAQDQEELAFTTNCRQLADACRRSFAARFFDGAHAWAADVVDRDGPGTADWKLRPNMVIPFALAHNIVPPDKREAILRATAKHLLTPRGLRTLAPFEPGYQGVYRGNVKVRDRAYHQGTAWMWLLLPYVKGVIDERASVPDLYDGLGALGDGLREHYWNEGCVMQANEIFDGDAPHTPRGCFAQAWSLAAMIEILEMLNKIR